MGIMLKTHDGTDWMSLYDDSLYRVYGPEQVAVLADYFETYGVPFHAWCVVTGLEPTREAEMAAQVVAAGARSLTIDVEPHSGFWQGTARDALTFGREFRRHQPDATLIVSLDPRPWVLTEVPLAEFASFSQGFAPQTYWETFKDSANTSRFQASGFPPGRDGITPEFLLDVSRDLLGRLGLALHPVGQGASTDMNAWRRFAEHAADLGMNPLSVWRHGVTDVSVWRLLSGRLPQGPTPTPPAELSVGATARVTGTGSCLNVRESPITQAAVRACLTDGTVVIVRNGPIAGSGYRWWQIQTEATLGWAAEGEPDGVRWLVPLS